MKAHPLVQQQNGIVSVQMQAQFIGDVTDMTDKQRIQAYGDPQVNLGGLFTDPSNNAFSFTFPASELFVGITTQMSSYTARFMTALPAIAIPGQPPPAQGPLDCLTTNPVEAATVWAAAIQTQISASMTTLRARTPAQLSTLPDQTI